MQNDELIAAHMKVAAKIATKIAKATGRVVSDIESEAVYGLVRVGVHFDSTRWRTSFKTFVSYGIVNQVKTYLRYKYQQPFHELDDVHPSGEDYEQAAMNNELHRRLKRFVGRLPTRQRRIIRLRYLDGYTQAEVAAMLGVNDSRISQLERAALGKLRTGMKRRGVHKVSDIL